MSRLSTLGWLVLCGGCDSTVKTFECEGTAEECACTVAEDCAISTCGATIEEAKADSTPFCECNTGWPTSTTEIKRMEEATGIGCQSADVLTCGHIDCNSQWRMKADCQLGQCVGVGTLECFVHGVDPECP